MAVNNEGNKDLLSQILDKHPLKKEKPKLFNKILNAEVEKVHSNRFHFNNNLTAMNKEILRIFQNMASTINVQPKKHPKSKNWSAQQAAKNMDDHTPVPRIKIFETRLKEQQEHFNNMIKADVPKEIDFTDKAVSGDLITNTTIDQTMQKRQEELKRIMSDYQPNKKATEAWIKGEAQAPEQVTSNHSIKISPTSIVKKSTSSPNSKRVSFEIQEIPDTASLFNKLKIKPKETKPIESDSDFLKQIIQNQEKIMRDIKNIYDIINKK